MRLANAHQCADHPAGIADSQYTTRPRPTDSARAAGQPKSHGSRHTENASCLRGDRGSQQLRSMSRPARCRSRRRWPRRTRRPQRPRRIESVTGTDPGHARPGDSGAMTIVRLTDSPFAAEAIDTGILVVSAGPASLAHRHHRHAAARLVLVVERRPARPRRPGNRGQHSRRLRTRLPSRARSRAAPGLRAGSRRRASWDFAAAKRPCSILVRA
jgi:hypothetical protein